MHKEIFFDLAPAHQAYATGGLPAIEELYAAEVLTAEQRDAWRQIASGDPGRVASGNAAHLEREQWDVIADEYDEMRGHFPSGPAVTYAVTFVGAPSIDGPRGFPDVFPLTVGFESPGIRRVPLALRPGADLDDQLLLLLRRASPGLRRRRRPPSGGGSGY